MGVDYLGMEDLESRVKGQTLVYIYNTFFPGMIKEQEEITAGLDRFEQEMTFEFIPGVESFYCRSPSQWCKDGCGHQFQ